MKGPCAWCDADAVDSVAIKGSATSVRFCEDHRRVANEQASDSRAFDKPNVANKIFGKAASDRAIREAGGCLMRTCSECPRRFKPKRPHHVCCSQECRMQRHARLGVEEAQDAAQRVDEGVGSRGGNVRSIQEARDLQEAHKPEWSARIREHIARTLLETGFFHADDLDVLEVPVEHCNLKGAQIGSFRRNGLMLATGTKRPVSHPAANWRKADVFRISAKGRRELPKVIDSQLAEAA